MSHVQPSAIHRLVAVHLVLAMVPLSISFVTIDMRTLPIVWALAAVTFAQIMLLAIWVGMVAAGNVLYKVLAATIAAAYLGIWQATAQVLMSTELSNAAAVSAYVHNTSIILVLTALLTLALFGVRRLIGTIRFVKDDDFPKAEPRFHFSLLTLLAFSTVLALLLGLVRLSRMTEPAELEAERLVDYLLAVVVYGLNTLATIWATLGPGHVKRRLCVVFFVAVLLGFSFAIGAGNSPTSEPWWLFLSFPVVVVLPTGIVALTLLYLRSLGYRLIPAHAGP